MYVLITLIYAFVTAIVINDPKKQQVVGQRILLGHCAYRTGGHIKKTSLAQQGPRYLWYSPLTVFLNGRGVP